MNKNQFIDGNYENHQPPDNAANDEEMLRTINFTTNCGKIDSAKLQQNTENTVENGQGNRYELEPTIMSDRNNLRFNQSNNMDYNTSQQPSETNVTEVEDLITVVSMTNMAVAQTEISTKSENEQ